MISEKDYFLWWWSNIPILSVHTFVGTSFTYIYATFILVKRIGNDRDPARHQRFMVDIIQIYQSWFLCRVNPVQGSPSKRSRPSLIILVPYIYIHKGICNDLVVYGCCGFVGLFVILFNVQGFFGVGFLRLF